MRKREKIRFWGIVLLAGIVCTCIGWYALERMSVTWRWRAKNYEKLIDAASRYHKVPKELINGVIWQESRYRWWVKGTHGEIGLMQITPVAVQEWEQRTNPSRNLKKDELYDPWTNIYIGTWYLAWCWGHWEGYASRRELTLAEYNAGYGVVEKKWLPKKKGEKIKPEEISYPGTRRYVENVMRFMGK